MLNLESNLKSEYENAKILDYRDPANPNNHIVLTCEPQLMIYPTTILGVKMIKETLSTSTGDWTSELSMLLIISLKNSSVYSFTVCTVVYCLTLTEVSFQILCSGNLVMVKKLNLTKTLLMKRNKAELKDFTSPTVKP